MNALPLAADERVARLNGVAAAGSFSAVEIGGSLVQAVPVVDPLAANAIQLPVVAASPGLLEAARGTMATGRWFDPIHDERAERVAVLGPGAAARLNVDRVDHQPTVFIGDEPVVVIGILEDVARQADLLGAVIIPEGTAATRFGLAAPDRVVVDTEIGAAQLIGTQVALALSPNEPSLLAVRVPPDLRSARSGAEGDVNALFLVLGLVSLVVGALGIANVTLVSVRSASARSVCAGPWVPPAAASPPSSSSSRPPSARSAASSGPAPARSWSCSPPPPVSGRRCSTSRSPPPGPSPVLSSVSPPVPTRRGGRVVSSPPTPFAAASDRRTSPPTPVA